MKKIQTILMKVTGWLGLLFAVACANVEPEQPSVEQLEATIEAILPESINLGTTEILEITNSEERGGNWRTLSVKASFSFEEGLAEVVEDYLSGSILRTTHSKGDTFTKTLRLEAKRSSHGWEMHTKRPTWSEISGEPCSSYAGKDVAMIDTEAAAAIIADYKAQIAIEDEPEAVAKPAEEPKLKEIQIQAESTEPVIAATGKTSDAEDEISGSYIAKKMYERVDGVAVERRLKMILTDKRGKVRKRTAIVFRRTEEDRKQTSIRFEKPRSVKGMSFLTYDYTDPDRIDEQWLYLPAMKKVRRIPSSDRGDYFLGTDFTYNDVKDELKFEPRDYVFKHLETLEQNGAILHKISGKPSSGEIARELGYGSVVALVSEESWMPLDIVFFDQDKAPLKQVKVSRVEKLEGIWTALEIEARNLQTQHVTTFSYDNINYRQALDDSVFSIRSLRN